MADDGTKQRYISTSIWDDDWFYSLDDAGQKLYFYLLTNRETNVAGVYQITKSRMQRDLKWDKEKLESALLTFEEEKKAYYRCGYIMLPNAPKHQKWWKRGTIKAAIMSILKSLSDEVFEILLSEEVKYQFDLSIIKRDKRKKRQIISDNLKEKIHKKYQNKCAECDSGEGLVIDHIIPVSEGGDNTEDNLQLLCRKCHGKKHAERRWEAEYIETGGEWGTPDGVLWGADGVHEKDVERVTPIAPYNPNSLPSDHDFDSDSDSEDISLSSTVSERFEKARKAWNGANLPKYPYSALNTPPDDMRLCIPTFDAHTDVDIVKAISNYQKIRDGTGFHLDPVYQSFIGFMKAGKGVDKYADDAEPFIRCKLNGTKPARKDQTMEAAREVYDILRRNA